MPSLGRITTHGGGGKAYTAEGVAWSKAMRKENRGGVWGIVNNRVGLESQWEAVENETKM